MIINSSFYQTDSRIWKGRLVLPAVNNVIAYISLYSRQGIAMDLEDFSAKKTIRMDAVPAHRTYKVKGSMRLIDAGSFVAYITVVDKNDNIPISSTMSHFEIKKFSGPIPIMYFLLHLESPF